MKKLTIALIVCLLLVAPVFSTSAESCDSYIYADGSEFCAGQTLQLVFAADCDKVSGLTAEITLSDNLSLLSAKGLPGGWDFEIAGNTAVMYDINGEAPLSGETEFFELTVKVNSDCAPGDEVYLQVSANLATIDNGYKTVSTSAGFDVVLEECPHYDTIWQVITPPSGENAGVKAEVCTVCGEILRQEEISFRIGDPDLNGTVNVADAVLVARYTSKLAPMTEEQLQCGDVDGSGIANIADAVVISRYAARLINKFPVEL